MRRIVAVLVLCMLMCSMLPCSAFSEAVSTAIPEVAEDAPACITKALLIGIDSFVSRAGMSPAAGNNVASLQELLLSALHPPKVYTATGNEAPADTDQLKELLQMAFADAVSEDLLLIYICTHGIYQEDAQGLLLSDGITETVLTPDGLAGLLSPLPGRKLLILDACNSGVFIGRGMGSQGGIQPFDSNTAVLTASSAAENSWYWTDTAGSRQGTFYFTQQLCTGISTLCDTPADEDRDAVITLGELYRYLLENHGTSTPQLSPAGTDWALLTPGNETGRGAALRDITFSASAVKAGPNASFTVEYTASRPVCVAYQLTRQYNGAWDFAHSQILYDGAQRYTTLGELAGAVTAGRKSRVIDLSGAEAGYILLQLISLDNGKITVHAGHVIAVTDEACDVAVTLTDCGSEWRLFLRHDLPCIFTVTLLSDETGENLTRLFTRTASQPGISDGTELFFSKEQLAPYVGMHCRIKVKAEFASGSVTILSAAFLVD